MTETVEFPLRPVGSVLLCATGPRLFLSWVAIVLTICFLAGCSPVTAQVLHLHADPTFTRKQLAEGRVAILPAMSSSPLAHEKDDVAEQLQRHLAKARPGIGLVPQARVGLALSPDVGLSLKRYLTTRDMSGEDLQRLGASVGARFVVLVVFDEYSFGPSSRPVLQSAGYADRVRISLVESSSGQVVSERTERGGSMVSVTQEYDTRLAGTMSILDTVAGRPVWSGDAMVSVVVETSSATMLRDAALAVAPAAVAPMSQLVPFFLEVLVDKWP